MKSIYGEVASTNQWEMFVGIAAVSLVIGVIGAALWLFNRNKD